MARPHCDTPLVPYAPTTKVPNQNCKEIVSPLQICTSMTKLPLSTSHKWIFSSIGNSSFPYYPSLIGSSQPGVRGHPAVRSSFPRPMWVGMDGWVGGWVGGR